MTVPVLTVLATALLTTVGIWLAGRRALRRLGIEPMAALVWLGLAETPVDEDQHAPSAEERAARRAEERRGRSRGDHQKAAGPADGRVGSPPGRAG